MAVCHRTLLIVFILILVLSRCSAIFEDQVGKFDWKLSYVGKVKLANIDSKRIIAATEQNVLAALHLKSGQILWRQILESDQQIHLLFVDKEVVTISGSDTKNTYFVRGWDLNTGTLLWDWLLFCEQSGAHRWFIKDEKLIHVVISSRLQVTKYKIQNGENLGTSQQSTPWISSSSQCVLSKTLIVCISTTDNNAYLYYLDLLNLNVQLPSVPVHTLIGSAPGTVQILEFDYDKPAFLLVKQNIARIIIIDDKVPRAIPQNIFSGSRAALFENTLLQLEINPENPEKLIRVKSTNVHTNKDSLEIDIQYPLGLGAPFIVSTQCREFPSCDLLLSSSDDALTLVRLPEGKILWTREEALSRILTVEFMELPVSEMDASIENEFKSASGDVLSMLYLRIVSQMKQLSALVPGTHLLSSNSGLVRDEFGIHKLAVVATAVGKLFAIDTLTGSIVWSYRLPNVVPFNVLGSETMLLFVQRTARYAPLAAQCLLIAKDANTGNGILFRFDPITGYSISGIERLNYPIKQAMLLPNEDENHVKAVVLLSEQKEIHVYPPSAKSLLTENARTTFMFVAGSNDLYGYSFTHSTIDNLKINQVWELHLGPSQIIALSTRPSTERVHSQGRVLPDRSVYYKYVNPNLIALATLTEDVIHKHVVSVYLVDGITGLIMYSASHKRAKGPVHLIHSENWLVYSYFNERFRRYELTAVELYEGEEQSNSTIFSSHAVSWLPYAESQSYILPATPLTMASTLTERGITSKFILVALASGTVTQIPWAFLEPRLSDFACGPEESCIPYMPEIPLPPEASLNYNQSLNRAAGIRVAPARLESTSHVLVYGLDVFYTRVAPSKTFDMLKEDFDHRLIILVLSGLIIASYITKKLASRKALRQAWK